MKTVISHPYCFSPFYNFSHFYRRGGDYNRCDSSFGFPASLFFGISYAFFRQWFSSSLSLSLFFCFSPKELFSPFANFIEQDASFFLFFSLVKKWKIAVYSVVKRAEEKTELK